MAGRILVTGAAGFVGSHLVARLLREGHGVVGLDNLSYGSMANLAPVADDPRFVFKRGNVQDRPVLRAMAEGCEAIVHLAAMKIPRYGGALRTLQVNAGGAESVLEAARECRCRVVLASTSDIYGRNPRLPFNEESDQHLGAPAVARWTYAVSKILDEHWCFAYQDEFDLPISIVRFFGGYGPHQHRSWWGGPQSVFIDCALSGKSMPIHGDGLQTRTFTYVEDMVDGVVRILGAGRAVGKVFNIGATTEITILDMAREVWRLVRPGDPPRTDMIPYRTFGRYEDVRRRVPDVSRARDLLGFEAKVGLEEGLRRTIEWQRTAPEGTAP